MVLMLAFAATPARGAETAAQLMQRCAAKLNAAKSIKAGFTMDGNSQRWTGTFLSKGSKFSITMPGAGTWYDGSDLWSYSKTSGEATVWKPSKGELAESNPFLYISTASGYNVKYGEKPGKGEQILILTPKARGGAVKSVTITISISTLLPKSFLIAASAGTYKITVSQLQLNQSISDASFKYPKAKYPGVTVTDLR